MRHFWDGVICAAWVPVTACYGNSAVGAAACVAASVVYFAVHLHQVSP